TVKVKREELNQVIADFRSALEHRDDNVKIPAQKLYNWLIKPLEADLKQAKAKTIIYAPDGQLRYIPLAALYDGNQWLVQNYRINNITAKSLTNFNNVPQMCIRDRLLASKLSPDLQKQNPESLQKKFNINLEQIKQIGRCIIEG
ncbi:CHAT domain-containing protein, partial [Nostoc punctiforme UO1]|uniref:CHAT domain-containing protein n=1 Tax=Nostoc punctiforme TaxID=272131 RepID=UPI00309C1C8D